MKWPQKSNRNKTIWFLWLADIIKDYIYWLLGILNINKNPLRFSSSCKHNLDHIGIKVWKVNLKPWFPLSCPSQYTLSLLWEWNQRVSKIHQKFQIVLERRCQLVSPGSSWRGWLPLTARMAPCPPGSETPQAGAPPSLLLHICWSSRDATSAPAGSAGSFLALDLSGW